MRFRRAAATIGISLAAHGLVLARALWKPEAPPPFVAAATVGPAIAARAQPIATSIVCESERRALVDEARAAKRAGKLELGDFLLRASKIDAEEEGRAIDLDAVRAAYAPRVAAIRDAIADDAIRDAVPTAFGDLRYFGRPGGIVADALVDRAGSCEQIAQLIAAAVYDAGARDAAYLRYYGGSSSTAVAHLAPILLSKEGEYDLLSGGRARTTGTRFPASELVEAYARAHGLAPTLKAVASRRAEHAATPTSSTPGPATIADGMPDNADVFPGSLPLFAGKAVGERSDDGADEDSTLFENRSRAQDCAFFVRLAALDPPRIRVEDGARGAPLELEPRRVPSSTQLESRASLLRAAEENASAAKDPAMLLMSLACQTAVARDLAADLALSGDASLARYAQEKSRNAAAAGARAVAAVAWDTGEGAKVREKLAATFSGQTWLLLVLDGGDKVVLDLARDAAPDDWGQIDALAALVVSPKTRARGLARTGALSRRDQIDVMHEIYHAHDHMQPWGSNYELDAPPGTLDDGALGFVNAYRVFRALAWHLWEGRRPPAETLAKLDADALAAGLDADWQALLLEYYGRNLLGLMQHRANGMEVVRLLQRAVAGRNHPALRTLSTRLAEIADKGTLDPVTLSDAWRLR